MASRIEDYALLGDCRGAALIGKDGSIDWLCLPRFDSPACCASLLGEERHGRWQIAPTQTIRSLKRYYRPGTLILETELEVERGRVRLIDFMSPQTGEADVFRIVRCMHGEVPMSSHLGIRFDYGSILPWLHPIDRGIWAVAGPDCIYCVSDILQRIHGQDICSEFHLKAGQEAVFQLTWTATHDRPPLEKNVLQTLDDTQRWWCDWSDRCSYRGPWREPVIRSLVTLKSLTYQPTGGIVAAPTTSLPEQIGGTRNWDYRFCWLRDSTFTLYSLLVGGYIDEARAWRQWLVNAAAGDPSQLQIMYGVAGERRLTEIELPWLFGYENSRPVRIGNAAYRRTSLMYPGRSWKHSIWPVAMDWILARMLGVCS